jgi:hypothetical protein
MPLRQRHQGRNCPPIIVSLLVFQLAVGCGNKPSFGDLYDITGNDPALIAPTANPGSDDATASQNQSSPPIITLPPEGSPQPGDDSLAKRVIITEGRFPADLLVQSEVIKEFGMPNLTHTFTLKHLYVNKNKKVQQVIRPTYKDEYTQQPTGLTNSEDFDQIADRALDILVVVDNSPSMKDNQKKLSERLETLLTYVKDSDWVVGVTTTDVCKTCLRGLIKKGDPDALTAYKDAVTPGTHGFFIEKGILTAVRSLQGACIEQPWIREQSSLAVLYVTDEDNCSDGDDCKKKPWSRSTYLTDYLKQIREPGMNARVYGLMWPPNVPKDQCKAGRHQGKVYAEAIKATKGVYGSICQDDWSPTLMQISKDMQETLNTKFTLKYDPEPSTVKVFVNGTELKTGFKVQGRVVEVMPAPADKAMVKISYRYGVTAGQTVFKLRFPPMDNKVNVTINGTPVADTDFTLDMVNKTVTFDVPPPAGAKIIFSYKGDSPLNDEYALADKIKPGSLRITINGTPTTDFSLDDSKGIVTFNVAPPEAAMIEFSYVAVGNPIYDYPFNAPPGTPPDLNAYDTVTLAPVRVTYANGLITVNPDDYQEGRSVSVVFPNASNKTYDVVLPQAPISNTVKAVGGQQTCLPPNLSISGTTVNLMNCNFADNVTQAAVSYTYVGATYQEFVLTVARIPEAADYQVWTVWVNDVETTDYTRVGNIIRFASPLPTGSVVRIRLIQDDK